ncbi:MAG: autotransporter-associated beta strand repeat-containing protein, partial [Verrucomicrobiales bacterium]|nr:autotransporter-associated beta strand repeat-containing protein [Verrucomicrobiales bacterium]
HFNNDITTTSSTRWDQSDSSFTGNLPNGTKVRLTGGTIPAPFNSSTDYYVVNATGLKFELSGSPGGGSIAITSGGVGQTNFTTPDNSALAGTKSVYLEGARTVGQIVIGDLSGTQQFRIESGSLSTNNLIFDMGSVGGGNAFINKFQGGVDFIDAPIVLTENLNVRTTTQILELGGSMSGAGTLTAYGNGRLRLTGDNSFSTVPLWLWNRGTNNVNNNAQVELASTSGPAVGGDIRVGNASLGGNGHAVLQLQQGRTNQNQIKDSASVIFDGINGRWAYMKLMGGSETVERILDLTSGAVIENRETESLGTTGTLTINGTRDSRVSGYLRNNAYNPYASLEPVADAAELANYNTAPLNLVKQGSGTLTLAGTNIYYGGTTTVSGGTLVLDGATRFRSNITNSAAVVVNINSGTWNFNFDHDGDQTRNPAEASPTALQNLTISGSGSLTKTGLGIFNLSSNNTIGGGLKVYEGGMVLGGNNTITGGINVSGEPTIDRDLTLLGTNTIGLPFNVVGDYGAAGSTVTISGLQTMSSGSAGNRVVSFTNTTAILNGTLGRIANATSITLAGRAGTSGVFRLDNSTDTNADRVSDTTAFISKGGTFNYIGGASTNVNESIGQLTLNSGELQISHSGRGTLTFASSLVRNAGATLRIDGADGMGTANQQVKFGTAPAVTNSLVGAWATVGKEWATYSIGNGLGALGTYATGAESTWAIDQNVKASASQSLGANRAVNSLNLQAAGNLTVTVNASTRALSIASGGILSGSADATARTHTFNNGIVTVPSTFASSGAELITTVHTGTLNFNSTIDESFVVTGTKSTSSTTITGLASTAGLIPGMKVEGLGIPLNATIASVVNGTSITLSATPTSAGATALTFSSGAVGVTKTGNGLLVLNGVNHYLGKTIVNQGTLRITSEANLGDNPTAMDASHLLLNGGTLQINSSMTMDDTNRGITIGDAGARIEVGTANANVFTVNLNTPITATGVFEVAVRGDDSLQTSSVLNVGTISSSNTFAGGIKTEQFVGLTNVNGANTIGNIYVELGELSLNHSNTLTGDIRMVGGVLSLKGSNAFTGKVTMSGGRLNLFSANSLGNSGIDLALGNGTLALNGTNQVINSLSGNVSASIQNGNDVNSINSTVTLNLGTSATFSGTLDDGGSMGARLGVTKIGPGTLLLNNIGSAFTGTLRISEGVVATTFADNGGAPSPLGAGGSDGGSLILSGGGLRFDLTVPAVTDRSFTLGAGATGGTIAAAGTTREATITFGVDYTKSASPLSTPAMQFEGSGHRTLTLSGFQAGYNVFNVPFGDKSPAEQTALLKIGAGYWEIGRQNAYTGLTTVQEGRLAIAADGALGTYIPSTSTTVTILPATESYRFSGNLPNGTPLKLSATSMPGTLSADATYYVIESSGSSFMLSASPAGDPIAVDTAGVGVNYYSSQGAGVNLIGGALELKGVNYTTPEALSMEGGQLFAQIGTNAWAGPVSVNVNSTINVLEGASIELSGVLSGNRGITQAGEGTVILSGEADPLAVGGVDNNRRFYSLNAGTLVLDYSDNNNSKLVDQASLTLGGSRRGGTL